MADLQYSSVLLFRATEIWTLYLKKSSKVLPFESVKNYRRDGTEALLFMEGTSGDI